MKGKKLSIQIFSDLHLEAWNKLPELPVNSKYLFLAGDICTLIHPLFYPFFDYCSSKWEKVFYTPGNHEFYVKRKNYNELSFEYKQKLSEKYKNVFYLDNEYISLDENTNVYGTTFWTVPPFKSTQDAKMYINDYHWITYFNKNKNKVVDLDINYVKELSNNSVDKLKNYLDETKKDTIVMTHFPPLTTYTSHIKHLREKNIASLYFSWPDETIKKFNLNSVSCWISGHTHWTYDFEKDGSRFIANQLGYKNEVADAGINEAGVYEI